MTKKPSATGAPATSAPVPWRTVVGRGSRVAAVAGLAAVAAFAGSWWSSPPTLGPESGPTGGVPLSQETLINATTLVCPGAQRQGIADMRSVATGLTWNAAVPPAGTVPSGVAPRAGQNSASATLRIASIGGGQDLAQGGDAVPALANATQLGDSKAAPNAVVAVGTGSDAPGLVATQMSARIGDDDQGLALTPCTLPSTDIWLVGGGADASQNERLILSNPGSNAVTATVVVHGAKGPLDGGKGRAVSVPATSRVALSLDALAPGEPTPAVHVTSQGGVLSAVLHEGWIEGATARGFDDSIPTAAPAKVHVVSGINSAAAPLGATTLRLVNPGAQEALARVDLLTAAGTDSPAALRAVRVPGGGVAEVGLPAGTDAARVRSDTALVAAARVDRRSTNASDRVGDFAWASAQAPVHDLTGIALPKLDSKATVVLVADTEPTAVTITTVSGGKATRQSIDLRPDSTVTHPLPSESQVWISSKDNGFHAAVSLLGGTAEKPLFSVASLPAAPVTTTSVPVREVAR